MLRGFKVGAKVSIRVERCVTDESGRAAVVTSGGGDDDMSGLICDFSKKYPHITIGTAASVKAVYSNALLEKEELSPEIVDVTSW